MEGAQLAHPETLRGEQVRFRPESEAVVAQAKRLATLAPGDLTAYRAELAAAPATDPYVESDRAALALFDRMRATGVTA